MITIVVNIMQSGPQVSTHGCDNNNEIYKNKLILCQFCSQYDIFSDFSCRFIYLACIKKKISIIYDRLRSTSGLKSTSTPQIGVH